MECPKCRGMGITGPKYQAVRCDLCEGRCTVREEIGRRFIALVAQIPVSSIKTGNGPKTSGR